MVNPVFQSIGPSGLRLTLIHRKVTHSIQSAEILSFLITCKETLGNAYHSFPTTYFHFERSVSLNEHKLQLQTLLQ